MSFVKFALIFIKPNATSYQIAICEIEMESSRVLNEEKNATTNIE